MSVKVGTTLHDVARLVSIIDNYRFQKYPGTLSAQANRGARPEAAPFRFRERNEQILDSIIIAGSASGNDNHGMEGSKSLSTFCNTKEVSNYLLMRSLTRTPRIFLMYANYPNLYASGIRSYLVILAVKRFSKG